ncbi:heparan-alpha-glucosaminide N-acetyltransferase domain-containing protein [Alkalimonas sp.]|uniref:acyltransferase family protein n=1 Tax=Alkalimonas sp. TaxID=1872453 RepID=UPI00263B025A|nr:heparan-alpha-glucosaminide N-acetyltransferase domain-containing protein [Alkalimonas sp.]MCC5827284.1 DUF1624 domain-containing protein [Alkalimonas sp.]
MKQWWQRHADGILQQLPADRLLALDVFRGLTITAMILVNNPGSWAYIYGPLRHADWHGWTVTDLIFPFFIFIVGISMQLSLCKHQRSPGAQVQAGALRSLKLMALGLLLALSYYNLRDANFDWVTQRLLALRYPGVLQRIGLVYFCCLLLVLWLPWRGRLLAALALCGLYLLGMYGISYQDDAGNSYRGLLEHGNSFAAWLDHQLLGPNHLYYRSATPFAFDPEGIWSTLPAISSCLAGVLTAQYLQQPGALSGKIKAMLLAGLAAVLLAELWHGWLPINKPLWTPSYVLLSTGYAWLVLAACLWLCDVKGYRRWTAPFVVFGANAILFFVSAGLAARLLSMIPVGDTVLQVWLYRHWFQPLFGNYNGSLAFALCFLALAYLAMYGCYRKGWIWKV